MKYDIFFSISQTPVDGHTPTEAVMFQNFFDQVKVADELGFGVAWIAESHLSSQVQKETSRPVIPHWQGEVGLNVDVAQLAHKVFAQTQHIEVGSAIMNILCNGGPIAAAEKIACFAALHGVDPEEKRKLHVGFAAGRFDFMNRAYGVDARNPVEEAAWRSVKGKVFREAAEIFLRLLNGEVLSSDQLDAPTLSRADFRSDDDWQKVLDAHGEPTESIELARRWEFEKLKIIPQDFRRELIQFVVGSHDPALQEKVQDWAPVQVFNLSITSPEIIEKTHERLAKVYHQDGGSWERGHMPRTVFVFINEQEGLSSEQKSAKAQEEARAALGAYWTALEGTLDPSKVEKATHNALIGNADEVAAQMVERFHPDDRLMLWFDFFNHDNERVMSNMRDFMNHVPAKVDALLQERQAG